MINCSFQRHIVPVFQISLLRGQNLLVFCGCHKYRIEIVANADLPHKRIANLPGTHFVRHFAGFAKFCGCQFLIRHSRIGQIGVLKCFDPGLFFLAPTLRGSFFLQTGLLCPLFFLLAFLPLCSLLCNDHLTVRLGSSLERRQGKYEKCDNSNGCGQPAPRNSAFRLFRFVLLRQRRKRKRRVFRKWFDFKRSWLLWHRLHRRRFYWYGRHRGRSFFVLCWLDGRGFLLRKCRLLGFA